MISRCKNIVLSRIGTAVDFKMEELNPDADEYSCNADKKPGFGLTLLRCSRRNLHYNGVNFK